LVRPVNEFYNLSAGGEVKIVTIVREGTVLKMYLTHKWLVICLATVLCLENAVYSTDSIYGGASHFWPLDSITGIKEVVADKKATIYGNDGVSLKGKGNGYLEIDTGKAALNLGEYKDKCLIESKDCRSGMTMTFWLRIHRAVPNRKPIDLLNIKSSSSIDIIKVKMMNYEHPSIEYSGNLGNSSFYATSNITLGVWIHSSLVLTKSGGISLFLNAKSTPISQVEASSFIGGSNERVSVFVGQWVALHEFGKTYGPIMHYDEIAIFYEELGVPSIKRIVLKNFGQIKLQKECLFNRTSLTIKWQPPFDTYEHLIGYAIVAKSSKYFKTYTAPKHANEATFFRLASNTKFEFKVIAETSFGYFVNGSTTVHCTTSLQEISEKGKGGLSVTAIDTHKIRVIWTIPDNSKERPIAYGVSHGAEGSPSIYKLIYERNSLNYTIINLKPNKRYKVTVTVFTKESGVFAVEEKYATTKRIICLPTSPIRNLSTNDVNWNSAMLIWLPPFNYTEPTVAYKIHCTGRDYNRIYETSETAIQLDSLSENTQYSCNVSVGAKDIGYFDRRIETRFYTLVRFPVPVDINITKLLWNMAELSWQPIKKPENIVYELTFHQEGNPGLVHSTQTPHTSLVLKDLQQDMGYFFTLRSGNGTVFGKRASRKTFFATPDRNECLDGSHSCKTHEICMNKRGSYECHCNEGYSRDGKVCKQMSKSEPKCRKETARNIEWSETQSGRTAHKNCPAGTGGIARRNCLKRNSTFAQWKTADLSDCVSFWLNDFLYEVRSKEQNSSQLMTLLKDQYRKQHEMVGGDIRNVVKVMGNIVGMVETSKRKASKRELVDIAQNLVSLTDDLLSSNAKDTWTDIPKKKQAKSAGGMLKNVESMAYLCSSFSNQTAILIETNNTVMEIRRLNENSALKFSSPYLHGKSSIISLPNSATKSSDAVYYGTFRGIENFLGAQLENTFDAVTNDNTPYGNRISNVVAATLFPEPPGHFEQPVVITQKIAKNDPSETPQCVFWNFSAHGSGQWSTSGCHVHASNDSHVICHCFHLTNFAVLMSVTRAPLEMKQTHKNVISLITKICIGISLLALVVSFASFCAIRLKNSERNTIHKHLVAALFLAQLLFLFGIDRTSNLLICRLIAIGLHYLFLVAFTLMGMEGFILYTMLVKVYKRNDGIGFKKLLFACWVIPVVVVGTTASVGLNAYANEKYCWINQTRGFIWSFVGPVIFIIAFNSVIFGLAVKIMNRKSKRRDLLREEIWYWMKCLSMLVTVLGLAWLIGIFYIDHSSIIVAYIFSIINASQGLAIFVFLCVLDQRMQELYCKFFCCSTRAHYNPNTSRSGSTKSSMSSRKQKEMCERSLQPASEEVKPLHEPRVSMENQEIMIEFSEEKAVPV